MALVAYDSSDESLHSESDDDRKDEDCRATSSSRSNDGVVLSQVIVEQNEPELDDVVKRSENELAARHQIAKTRKPVQIFLPSLSQADSDSDDDNSVEPAVKRIKTTSATGKCGLFSMLPPPASATQLIPHKLAKNVTTEQPQKKIPNVNTTNGLRLAGSTVHAKTTTTDSSQNKVTSHEAHTTANKFQVLLAPACDPDDNEDDESSPNFFALRTESELSRSKPENISDMPDEVLHHADLNEAAVARGKPSYENSHHYNANVYDNIADQFHCEMDDGSVPVNESDQQESTSSCNFDEYLQDEQFLRLCGRKLNSKQAINVIDIHADEQLRDVDLTKSLSEEAPVVMSHSKKRNKDLPSSQQKRKHQITYLAYKAKEREMELKNQWAENKFNKRQTQSKYGF